MDSTAKKPRKPWVNWSQTDWIVLEDIVNKTKTKSGVPMVKLLDNTTPKNNQLLCV